MRPAFEHFAGTAEVSVAFIGFVATFPIWVRQHCPEVGEPSAERFFPPDATR